MPVLANVEFTSLNDSDNEAISMNNDQVNSSVPIEEAPASLYQYLLSIIFMPHSLRMVCLTNLFCWMAHVRQYENSFVHYN